jgi:hypothetical protein
MGRYVSIFRIHTARESRLDGACNTTKISFWSRLQTHFEWCTSGQAGHCGVHGKCQNCTTPPEHFRKFRIPLMSDVHWGPAAPQLDRTSTRQNFDAERGRNEEGDILAPHTSRLEPLLGKEELGNQDSSWYTPSVTKAALCCRAKLFIVRDDIYIETTGSENQRPDSGCALSLFCRRSGCQISLDSLPCVF